MDQPRKPDARRKIHVEEFGLAAIITPMAIGLPGPIIDKMKGSIKGTSFQSLGPFQVIKGKARPNRPNRSLQLPTLNQMQRLAPLWSTLTPTQQSDWSAYADTVVFVNSLGTSYKITGQQHYMRAAMVLSTRGAVVVPVVPTQPGLPSVPIYGYSQATQNLRVDSVTPAHVAGQSCRGTVYILTRGSVNTASSRIFSTYILALEALPFTIATNYDTAFAAGLLVNGWVKFRFIDEFNRISSLTTNKISYTT